MLLEAWNSTYNHKVLSSGFRVIRHTQHEVRNGEPVMFHNGGDRNSDTYGVLVCNLGPSFFCDKCQLTHSDIASIYEFSNFGEIAVLEAKNLLVMVTPDIPFDKLVTHGHPCAGLCKEVADQVALRYGH